MTAVAFTDGQETGRSTLRSASGQVRLTAVSDRAAIRADDTDLAFVEIGITDGQGVLHVSRDRRVTVTVTGSGRLQGLASAALSSDDDYAGTSCRTFRGRALAVIRPTGAGTITVNVRSDDEDEVVLEVQAR